MVLLVLQGETGVYSRVTAGMILPRLYLFSDISGVEFTYEGQLRNLFEAWHVHMDGSRYELGEPGTLSSCQSDIGIPINFQEGSGIITF